MCKGWLGGVGFVFGQVVFCYFWVTNGFEVKVAGILDFRVCRYVSGWTQGGEVGSVGRGFHIPCSEVYGWFCGGCSGY